MDKYRRPRKTSPPQQSTTATCSSSAAGVASSTSSTKFTIEQKVSSGAVKKGPYSVKRSVDPNDLIITRRLGEGSKPLFSRSDICVNRSVSPKKHSAAARASSSDSSSPDERHRYRVNPSKHQTTKRKSVEKVPYFLDQKREKDRIKRVYGSQTRRSRSLSYERTRKPTNVHSRSSRSRSPPSYRRHRSYTERRSPSRERYRPRHRTEYSRSRSRSRERKRSSRNRRNGSVDEPQPPAPVIQFIPIPVPAEYQYPAWGAPIMPPQPRFPFVMRPPAPNPYIPRHFRQPRYAPNAYQRGSFRPRQY